MRPQRGPRTAEPIAYLPTQRAVPIAALLAHISAARRDPKNALGPLVAEPRINVNPEGHAGRLDAGHRVAARSAVHDAPPGALKSSAIWFVVVIMGTILAAFTIVASENVSHLSFSSIASWQTGHHSSGRAMK